ncbi:MAG: hypothetical protein ACKE9I_06340 [Methylophagaceae bacterium]
MTEQNSPAKLTEQQHEQRKQLFRYTDLDHPVIKVLFDLQLEDEDSQTSEKESQ